MSDTPKTRNARACEACRASKARCIYKSDSGICTRCEDNRSTCIVRDKARPRRGRSSQATPSSKESSLVFTKEFSLALPAVDAFDGVKDAEELYEDHKAYFEDDEQPSVVYDDSRSGSRLQKRTVSLGQAEELLSTFKRKSSFFPFVLIPPEATVPSMAKKSPFLLLAVLTAASATDGQLFHQMNHEFRRVLSIKVIAEGKKALEYLQGLLVYIVMSPEHIKPKHNQTFMYMTLCAGLVTDLGLDNKCFEFERSSSLNAGSIGSVSFSSAEKRAYLGCYCLSAAVATGFNKPSLMPFKSGMERLAESLMPEEGEHRGELASLIKFQSLSDRIRESQASIEIGGITETQAINAAVDVQLFNNELQEWRDSTSDHVRNLPSVALADRFAAIEIYSHQLGFLRRPYRDYLRKTADQAVDPLHLSSCLLACKMYFEYLLSIPATAFLSFTMIQWHCAIHAIIVLSRLTFLMASNMGWDSEVTKSNIPMVTFMDNLCDRFWEISSTQQMKEETPYHPDFFRVLNTILETFKKAWSRRVANITPEPSAFGSTSASLCPIYDPSLSTYLATPELSDEGSLDFVSTSASTTGAADFPKSSGCVPLYHDLWATMNCSWAEI